MTTNWVVQRLNYPLGFRPTGSSAEYSNPAGNYDFAFGGIPFMSAASPERPLGRSTAQYRREQFDNSQEPGEQSLTGWWLRSQASFHLGAGLRYEDPTEETNRFRFYSSEGVNVWTPGQLSLLPTTTLRQSGGTPTLCHGAVDGTTDVVFFSSTTSLYRVTSAASAAVTWGGAGNILSLTDDGSSYYAADATSIYKGTLAGGAGAAVWNTGSVNVTIGWVKQRLMAGIGNKIYELTGAGPGLPAATYTHPNTNWKWTAVTEGPDSIYFAGYAGGRSVIVRLALDSQGLLPALTQATTVAEMPAGELIHSLLGYVGTFLAIGTSKGVRIAQVGSNGLLEVGPLIETTQPVKALTGLGNFIYCGYSSQFNDGSSGLLRIDIGNQLPSGKFAYAVDLNAHVSGDVTGVTKRGASNVLAFAVSGHGLYEAHATNLETLGFLTTYRVRYSTMWPKLFKRLGVRAAPPFTGTVAVSTIDQTDAEVPLATVSPDLDSSLDLAIQYPQAPQQYLSLKFQLNRATATTGPTMTGWQLKAIPGGPRPRELRIPLQCFDYEKDRSGVSIGYDGWAMDRLAAVELADSAGDIILFQDLVSGSSLSVLIQEIQFQQTSPPGAGEGAGGVLMVSCRTAE